MPRKRKARVLNLKQKLDRIFKLMDQLDVRIDVTRYGDHIVQEMLPGKYGDVARPTFRLIEEGIGDGRPDGMPPHFTWRLIKES